MTKIIRKIPFWFIAPCFVICALVLISLTIKRTSPNVCCGKPNLQEDFDYSAKTGYIDGQNVNLPQDIFENKFLAQANKFPVLGTTSEEKWIEVDLSEQKLRAWEGNNLFLETLISTGLPWFPTPQGEFRIWAKARATKMEGGEGRYYYNLPNVPYVMFFENDKVPGYRGYGLHGTYWHNDFGKVHSHGCVNLPTKIAEKLYYWTQPEMPQGKFFLRTDENNPGTRIAIHE